MNTNNSILRVAAAVGTIAGSATSALIGVAAGLSEAPVVAGVAGAVALGLGYLAVKLFAGTREALRANQPAFQGVEELDGFAPYGSFNHLGAINPATGLPMVGGLDTGGNMYGAGRVSLPDTMLPKA